MDKGGICGDIAPCWAGGSTTPGISREETLTGDFVQLIHELVLQFGEGLLLLAGACPGHAGGVGAGRHRGGGGGLGRRRRQRFPSTLAHGGDAGKARKVLQKTGEGNTLEVLTQNKSTFGIKTRF